MSAWVVVWPYIVTLDIKSDGHTAGFIWGSVPIIAPSRPYRHCTHGNYRHLNATILSIGWFYETQTICLQSVRFPPLHLSYITSLWQSDTHRLMQMTSIIQYNCRILVGFWDLNRIPFCTILHSCPLCWSNLQHILTEINAFGQLHMPVGQNTKLVLANKMTPMFSG